AKRMIDVGVTIIDVGGESTRPGAPDVSVEEELERVIPVIKAIRQHYDVWISVDTSKAEVMRQAAEAGADIINDVRALLE
ncbi:dihydropteroate synthase, partial [Vibrio xuii]